MDEIPEEERILNEQAIARLEKIADAHYAEIKEVILRKLNDSFGADEVMEDEDMALQIALGWFQRITLEAVADTKPGPIAVDRAFENAYYQIAAQHIGSENFAKTHKPFNIFIEDEHRRIEFDKSLVKKK
ncbi:hypothetical protein phiOC_p233 [Ochrobactrum phage vB_OspM_OC]|nr:hypothetical protein phiOC_p233 [Ochrobactrum phage vB_OspM_OC]